MEFLLDFFASRFNFIEKKNGGVINIWKIDLNSLRLMKLYQLLID